MRGGSGPPAPPPRRPAETLRLSAWTPTLRCSNCGRQSPEGGLPFRCPACGGLFDLTEPLHFLTPGPAGRGLSRFGGSLPLPPDVELPSLGEGGTPLVPASVDGRRVYFKCEQLNPSGSFKDRGSVVLVAALRAAGVRQAVEDSSGNAGASLAAYAARGGLPGRSMPATFTSPSGWPGWPLWPMNWWSSWAPRQGP